MNNEDEKKISVEEQLKKIWTDPATTKQTPIILPIQILQEFEKVKK